MNKVLDKDTQLMLEFQQGNLDAYVKLYQRNFINIVHFCERFGNAITPEIAQDIAQDTFIKVSIHRDSYIPINQFNTWLYTIAGNLARTEGRKYKRRKTFSLTSLIHADGESNEEWLDQLIDPDTEDPAEIKDYTPVIEEIARCAEERHPFFTAFLLRDMQELSYNNISKILNVPIGTVRSRINRCRLALAGRLENYRSQFSF